MKPTAPHLLPRTQADAIAQGSTYYYTGKPCKQGHEAPRYTSTCNCTECARLMRQGKAQAARKASTSRARGWFGYPLHPDDMAAALAYCQGLDLARGRQPYVDPTPAAHTPRTPEQIDELRRLALGRVPYPEQPPTHQPDIRR